MKKKSFWLAFVIVFSVVLLGQFCFADYTVTMKFPNNEPAPGCNVRFMLPGIGVGVAMTDSSGIARYVTPEVADSTWQATILDAYLPFTPPVDTQWVPATVFNANWTVFP